ncbi:hypothetical protein [Pseudoxanthomonas kalamensis]|uniref:hypothetical protein n=1 Tax=Pseudoxanthomonas kalamensis TaxID=289483 RepID=UPI001390AE8B|nr:hypothetical protein [Pseudoxanthomonas kalamensis]
MSKLDLLQTQPTNHLPNLQIDSHIRQKSFPIMYRHPERRALLPGNGRISARQGYLA